MVIICKYLVPRGFEGITLFPFILLKSEDCKKNVYLVNHERIHLRQQLELLIVFFYVWYVIEFIRHFILTKNAKVAYKRILFEVEAYSNEHNLAYLKTRKIYSFLRNNT